VTGRVTSGGRLELQERGVLRSSEKNVQTGEKDGGEWGEKVVEGELTRKPLEKMQGNLRVKPGVKMVKGK